MQKYAFTNKLATTLCSTIIFGLIIVVAFRYYEQVGGLIKKIDLGWFALGIACYFCNYLCRASRIWIYAKKRGRFFPDYVKISGLHGFNSYFLPLRGGDLTLPFLLSLHVGIPLIQGSKILVRARLLDIFVLGFILIASTLLTPTDLAAKWRTLFFLAGMGFIALPYAATFLVRKGSRGLTGWTRKIIGDEQPAYPQLKESLLSLLVWFWTGATVFCVIRSLGMPLSFFDVWFVATVQLPLQLLPVQGLANAGTHEAGWVIALSMLGIQPQQGLPLALSSHVLIIAYVCLLGLAAVLTPSPRSSPVPPPSDNSH
jgi:uncharacterized membrane protein YbhN (UPF0104 family)